MATKAKAKAKAKAITPKQAAEAAGRAAAVEAVDAFILSDVMTGFMVRLGDRVADRATDMFEDQVRRIEAGRSAKGQPYEWDDEPVGIGGERRMGETTDRQPSGGSRADWADVSLGYGPVGIAGGGISPVARGTPATGDNQAEQLRAAAEKLAAISQSVRIQAVRVRERLGVVPNEPPSLALDVKGGAYEGEGLIPMVLRVVAEATDELARAECALCDVTVALE